MITQVQKVAMSFPRLGLMAASAVFCVSAVHAAQSAVPQSVLAGVYTGEQALRGEQVYIANCGRCHGDSLQGIEQAPALVGPQFNSAWDNEPLSALLSKIKSMPPDEQINLSRAQIIDVLTYLLKAGGLPAGSTPLSDDTSVLAKVSFHGAPSPAR